jgi:hypothetical protein
VRLTGLTAALMRVVDGLTAADDDRAASEWRSGDES